MTTEIADNPTTESIDNLDHSSLKESMFKTTAGVFKDRRNNFTIATAIGAAVGVGITALSDRATKGTLIGTTIFGGLITAGINNSSEILMYDDNASNLAVVGGAVIAETAIFGCVANLLFGKTPEESAE